MRIKLKDNSESDFLLKEKYPESEKDIRFFAETTLDKLAEKHGHNLIIFPPNLNDTELDKKDTILSLKDEKIKTSNYMGFVGRGETEIAITSRFDSGENSYLLHYMLQRVYNVNMFDLKVSQNNHSVWDFLIYLFPHYLKKALQQGLYKKYQRKHHNDSRVRGSIDVAQHLKHNIPFAGKIAYSTREYSCDNNLTQLVRHTIEHLRSHLLGGQNILRIDQEMTQCVAQIIAATPTYNRNERMRIIATNLKPERHPYFTEYTILQKLCIQILRREQINFGENKNEDKVYGLLFDGAWLWEKYLGTLLQDLNYTISDNNKKTNRFSLFENGRGESYPDFYIKNKSVLDAKYKWLGDKIKREDLHQIITYMHCLKAPQGGLIYPKKSNENTSHGKYGTLKGYAGDVYQFFLEIGYNTDFQNYCREMKENELSLISQIKKSFS